MSDLTSALAQLDELADELAARGDTTLAEKARSAAADVRSATGPMDLITTEEAAVILGIRSAPMVMRWARERILEGYSVGGWFKVTRASVERLKDSPRVAWEQAYERELDEVLEAFDAGDGPVPESVLPHIGRVPWDRLERTAP